MLQTADRNQRLTVVMIADMPPEAVVALRDYEDQVLPLLSRHPGRDPCANGARQLPAAVAVE